MARYSKTQVTQLSANEQAAINNINKNFDDIQAAIQDTVSRSGNIPTHMTADLDLNGKRIINAPAPKTDTDFVRRCDVVGDVKAVEDLVNSASEAAGQALKAAQDVQEIMEDEHLGLVSEDLALGDDSKIKQVAEDKDNIDAVAGNSTNINAVNANKTNINAVNSNKTNINAVAGNAANINTVATNISNINSVAGNTTNINAVAGNATNINAVNSNKTNIDTCASNISAITGASTQAANAAESARNSASSALASAESAALAYQYGNDKINQTHITNCLTDIPQDIKLELSGGALVLKAGSKIYVPNGSGTFAVVTLASDISRSAFGTQTGTNCIIECVYSGGNITAISWSMPTNTASGTTAPTNGIYYKTDTNYINAYSGGTVTDQRSFPIALVTMDSGTVTYIDQVFNGFGYIGGTVFALPGLKGLIPNGKNDDGTLNNVEVVLNSVETMTGGTSSQVYYGLLPNQTITRIACRDYLYNESENNIYNTNSGTKQACVIFSVAIKESGKITSFTPKSVFHALDWNDKGTIAGWSMPDFASGVSKTSGTAYQAEKDGYVYVWGSQTNNSNAAIDIYFCLDNTFSAANTIRVANVYDSSGPNGSSASGLVPVPKGIYYKVDGMGSVLAFNFYPCKGV